MTELTENQPTGTPTWVDLDVPDIEQAKSFYNALFGWDFATRTSESGDDTYLLCLLRGLPVAGLRPQPTDSANSTHTADGGRAGWTMYLATDDCDATSKRIQAAGGTLLGSPTELFDLGRYVIATDTVGARFGLWQGRTLLGCTLVNEPDSLVRNDLGTAEPKTARVFYPTVFDYTLDGNDDLPGFDFTFLRRPDGKEIGGIFGTGAGTPSAWATTFEVADTDAVLARAVAAGGTAGEPEDSPYGRFGTITDPFGTELSVITRPEPL